MRNNWELNIHLKLNVYYCPYLPYIAISGILSESCLWSPSHLFKIYPFIHSAYIYDTPAICQASGAHTLRGKAELLAELHPRVRGAQHTGEHLAQSVKAQKDLRQFFYVYVEWTRVLFCFSILVAQHLFLFPNRIFFWKIYSFPSGPRRRLNLMLIGCSFPDTWNLWF